MAPVAVPQSSWMLPGVDPAGGFCATTDVSVGAGGATSTEMLFVLSAPVHELSCGVTVYRQDPMGTALSRQESVAVAPLIVVSHVTLSSTATDSGSGVATARLQYAPTGTTTWSDGCTGTIAPSYTCVLSTATVADGVYDLRFLAVDGAGNTTPSASVTSRRIDNTGPSVTMDDPGAYLRATVTFTATSTDAGSGVASVRIQRAPTGSSTWTDVCTDTTSPYSCTLDTTSAANGSYDFRAVATDAAGNVSTSALVANRMIDNAAPTGTDVQATNVAGGTAAKPEPGDVVTYTFSEPMKAASILAGWAGASTPVTVRFTNGNPDVLTVFDSANTTQLALGSLTSGKKYVTANTTFTASAMVLSGSTISVTLGTSSGATSAASGTTTLQWTTSTAATDLAGNPMVAGTIAETGVVDLDF